jgi:hypothetical protein
MAPAAVSLSGRSGVFVATPRTPVVVELFTSEGCSSCPPADSFLSKLETVQPVAGAEIIAIEEHVDYWDQLGWRDPFSSADWTDRQRRYASVLGSGNIYTPQMVVNGSAEFVGSREQSGNNAIEQAAQRSTIPLALSAVAVPGKRAAEITVNFQNSPQELLKELEVWLAITETSLHNSVAGGENAGKELRHASVLRKLQRIGSAAPKNEQPGKTVLTAKVFLDPSWRRENLHAVAFLQERHRLRIVGAAQIPLNL